MPVQRWSRPGQLVAVPTPKVLLWPLARWPGPRLGSYETRPVGDLATRPAGLGRTLGWCGGRRWPALVASQEAAALSVAFATLHSGASVGSVRSTMVAASVVRLLHCAKPVSLGTPTAQGGSLLFAEWPLAPVQRGLRPRLQAAAPTPQDLLWPLARWPGPRLGSYETRPGGDLVTRPAGLGRTWGGGGGWLAGGGRPWSPPRRPQQRVRLSPRCTAV